MFCIEIQICMCYNYFAAVFNGGKFKKGVTYMTRHMKKYLSLALAAAVSGMSTISVNAAEETKSGGKLSYYTYIGGCAKLDEIIGNIGNIKDFFTPTEKTTPLRTIPKHRKFRETELCRNTKFVSLNL